jgi:acyl transferase domain-containing protein
VLDGACGPTPRGVAFLFPGVGDHYPDMMLGLYRAEPVFRAHVDHCAERLRAWLGADLRETMWPGLRGDDAGVRTTGPDLRRRLRRDAPPPPSPLDATRFAQAAVFVLETALARQLGAWGVVPDALIGHSIGEVAAACVAGVLELDAALELVARRALLIEALPPGAMLAAMLSEAELRPLLGDDLSLAAVNAPGLCVAAGPPDAIDRLAARLEADGVIHQRLATAHAFHSRMLDPIAAPLREAAARFARSAPRIPCVSNVTGTWLSDADACDPDYWARHACSTVRFSDGVRTLCANADRILVEVGPGRSLASFVLSHPPSGDAPPLVLPTTRSAYEDRSDAAFLATTLGRLWIAGVPLDGAALDGDRASRKVSLPTHPFEPQPPIVAGARPESATGTAAPPARDAIA